MREHRNSFMKLLQLKNNKHKSKHFSNILMKYQYLGILTSFFSNLTQSRVNRGKEVSIEELPRSDCPVVMSVRNCLDWRLIQKGPAHHGWHPSSRGGPTLFERARQAWACEHAQERADSSHSSASDWSGSASWNHPFPKFLLVRMFHHSNRKWRIAIYRKAERPAIGSRCSWTRFLAFQLVEACISVNTFSKRSAQY